MILIYHSACWQKDSGNNLGEVQTTLIAVRREVGRRARLFAARTVRLRHDVTDSRLAVDRPGYTSSMYHHGSGMWSA